MTITSVEEALDRLLEVQVEPTQPASADTLETDTGWVFFNIDGYLGTVTPEGEVILEEEHLDEDE